MEMHSPNNSRLDEDAFRQEKEKQSYIYIYVTKGAGS